MPSLGYHSGETPSRWHGNSSCKRIVSNNVAGDVGKINYTISYLPWILPTRNLVFKCLESPAAPPPDVSVSITTSPRPNSNKNSQNEKLYKLAAMFPRAGTEVVYVQASGGCARGVPESVFSETGWSPFSLRSFTLSHFLQPCSFALCLKACLVACAPQKACTTWRQAKPQTSSGVTFSDTSTSEKPETQ